jgi:hypothetical protein
MEEPIPFSNEQIRKGYNIPWLLGRMFASFSINNTPVEEELVAFTKNMLSLDIFSEIITHSFLFHQRDLLSSPRPESPKAHE